MIVQTHCQHRFQSIFSHLDSYKSGGKKLLFDHIVDADTVEWKGFPSINETCELYRTTLKRRTSFEDVININVSIHIYHHGMRFILIPNAQS